MSVSLPQLGHESVVTYAFSDHRGAYSVSQPSGFHTGTDWSFTQPPRRLFVNVDPSSTITLGYRAMGANGPEDFRDVVQAGYYACAPGLIKIYGTASPTAPSGYATSGVTTAGMLRAEV